MVRNVKTGIKIINNVCKLNNKQCNNVLEICKVPDIDISKLKKLVSDYMEPRKEFYMDNKHNLTIESMFSEWWISNLTNGKHIGKGNGAMDIKTKYGSGIDVMCVIMNNKYSNEKSLIQNFNDSGSDLDILFKEKNHIKAVELFKENLYKKISDVKKKEDLTDLYIYAFISTLTEVFLVCFKLHSEKIKDIISGGFVGKTTKCVNIHINNFIDPNYGNVKLYKSKKRMELRLHKNVINYENTVRLYTL
jgi:hypothetical protein